MPSTQIPSRAAKTRCEEARANYERYQRFLADDRDIDWALVLLFYSAIQLVQAHAKDDELKTGKRPSSNHDERLDHVFERINRVYWHYKKLYSASRDARYDLVKRSREDVVRIHDEWYVPIKNRLAQNGYAWIDTSVSNATEPTP